MLMAIFVHYPQTTRSPDGRLRLQPSQFHAARPLPPTPGVAQVSGDVAGQLCHTEYATYSPSASSILIYKEEIIPVQAAFQGGCEAL